MELVEPQVDNIASATGPDNLEKRDIIQVPLIHDALTFDKRQAMRMKDMEKRISDETKRKKREWERNVERMREEFLDLYPCDRRWASDEALHDLLVSKRRGSADVLDIKKMKTLFMEYPDSGRRCKMRFNVSGFEPENITVTTDGDRIIVRGVRHEEDKQGIGHDREYERKIEKPKEVDHTKLKSYLTTDNILIIEAPLPPKTLNLQKLTHSSPSRSIHGSSASIKTVSPTVAKSPSIASVKDKVGVPTFSDDNGRRKMSLTVDIGTGFNSKEITAMIIKDNRLQVKAKHEEKSAEKLCKNKYMKEFELPEKIETYSLRGGLTSEGKLYIGALGKGHATGLTKITAGEVIVEDINNLVENQPCNVLDLSSFPPTTPQIIASSYNYSN